MAEIFYSFSPLNLIRIEWKSWIANKFSVNYDGLEHIHAVITFHHFQGLKKKKQNKLRLSINSLSFIELISVNLSLIFIVFFILMFVSFYSTPILFCFVFVVTHLRLRWNWIGSEYKWICRQKVYSEMESKELKRIKKKTHKWSDMNLITTPN